MFIWEGRQERTAVETLFNEKLSLIHLPVHEH